MKLLYLKIIIILTSTSALSQQTDKKFGKENWSLNAGTDLFGPNVSLVNKNILQGEVYFGYHTYALVKESEELINMPTTGGISMGWNYLSKYASSKRLIYVLGIGMITRKERVGKESSYADTDMKGSILLGHCHGGIRYFLFRTVSISGYLGYIFHDDYSNSILTKYEFSGADNQSFDPFYANIVLYINI